MFRFFLRATLPVEAGNEMLRDPNFMQNMESIMGDIRPEATYFCLENGQRTIYFLVAVEDTSEMPRLAEPLWLSLQADVEVIPAMTQDDFGKAQAHIQAAVRKY